VGRVAAERRDLYGGEDRGIGKPRGHGWKGQHASQGRDLFRLVRQDDRMPVMIRRYELDEVGVIRPVTVGRKPRAQHSQEKQQKA
jgi:ribosomal protein L15